MPLLQFLTALLTLVEKVIQSVWLKKNWPLLIPVVTAAGWLLGLQNFFPPDPDGLFHHRVFLRICGAGLVLGGTLWWFLLRRNLRPSRRLPRLPRWLSGLSFLVRWFYRVFPRKSWRRLWVSAPMVITGFALVGVSFWQTTDRRLVIAIAKFAGDSPGEAAIARKVEARLYGNLVDDERSELRKGGEVPFVIMRFSDYAIGNPMAGQPVNEPSRDEERARAFGRSVGADLVIWGSAGSCGEDGIVVHPEFTLVNNDGSKTAKPERVTASYTPEIGDLYGKGKCIASVRLDEAMADLARLLIGGAYDLSGDSERAIGFLSGTGSDEAFFWIGLFYHRQARAKDDSLGGSPAGREGEVADLDKALGVYEKLIRNLTGNVGVEENTLLSAVAYFMIGQAYQERAAASIGNARMQDYGKAKDAYEESLRYYERLGPDEMPWQLHNNRGLALYALAESNAGNPIGDLQKANRAYTEGLKLLGQVSDETIVPAQCNQASDAARRDGEQPEGVALLLRNRGSARAAWGLRLLGEGQPGRDQLECAKGDLERALTLVTKNEKEEAMVKNNLANVSAELGNQTPGPDGEHLLRDAIVDYQQSLDAYEIGSLDYARILKSLAETYYDLGKRARDPASLISALGSYIDAVRMLRSLVRPDELADALLGGGQTRVAIFDLDRIQCRDQCLRDAIMGFAESERLFIDAQMQGYALRARQGQAGAEMRLRTLPSHN